MDFSALFQPAIITSAGGIVLAILLAWFLFRLLGNHLNHNTDALSKLAENTSANTEVLRGVASTSDKLAGAIGSLEQTVKSVQK